MTAPSGQIPALDPSEYAGLAGAVLLDVRELAEWIAGHAPQAIHIPLGELAERTGELPRSQTVVCICRSGARSMRAAELLDEIGLATHNLSGGMRAWSDAGLAVVTPAGEPGCVI